MVLFGTVSSTACRPFCEKICLNAHIHGLCMYHGLDGVIWEVVDEPWFP